MKLVCHCEDVTEGEVIEAIREGYVDIEALKRYTGVGTGPCQGKYCMILLLEILARVTGRRPEEIHLPTPRQPVEPVYIGLMAVDEKEDDGV
ncbi:MAG: (2Fe-2S)-binding protein [Candidatus Geothermarchaeales archaeon]